MDILDIEEGIIAHQVNCQHVAGAGLALQIRLKYPEWYQHYKNTPAKLGTVDIFPIGYHLSIASLYAQYDVGPGLHTDYQALYACLEKLYNRVDDWTVYFPYKMGCGLGGGDWDIVKGMIAKIFSPFEYEIVRR